MIKYTKEQTDAINAGWTEILNAVERTETSMINRMDTAIISEKRECSSVIAARAVLTRAFMKAYRNDVPELHEIGAFRDGAVLAVICGATMQARWPELFTPKLVALADAARFAQEAAIDAALAHAAK